MCLEMDTNVFSSIQIFDTPKQTEGKAMVEAWLVEKTNKHKCVQNRMHIV